MQFRVLGPLEVDAGDGPVALGGPKQRTVLANLLVRPNEVVPADTLIDEIWGEEPPSQARNTLQTYVSSLRKSLGSDVLLGRDPGYVLVVDPIDVDATRFDALVREAHRALPIDPRVAIDTLDDALALWRGPALADVANGNLFAEAARLDELRLEALEKRIDALLAIGDTARTIGELETLVARHPLREALWERLLLALYRDGRQGEALEAFQRAREVLADELGIDPSPELSRLHTQILAQDATLELRGEPLRGYRLLEQTGSSVVGTRFRAIQPRMERDVEIEVMRDEVASTESFVERFEREARAVAALEHPNILPLYDYWREPGRAYVVTRYVRGPTLEDQLTVQQQTSTSAMNILGQVAAALAFAHREGVAHGRLEASCVRSDPDGNVYLGGFTIGSGPLPSIDEDLAALQTLAEAMLDTDAPSEVRDLIDQERPLDARAFHAAMLTALGTPQRTVSAEPCANPYRGLQPFGEEDREVFFGRSATTRALVDSFRSSRFVAVVGPSGCGKSSLVLAGLVPAVRAEQNDAPVFVTRFAPGPHPFEQLASALDAVALRVVPRGDDLLEATSRGLAEMVDRAVPGDARIVLVIDQLEELFTVTVTEAERTAFLESIRVACVDPGGRLSVVATLRADFYDRPLAYPRFGELLAAHTFALAPLQPDELEHAIARPAARADVRVEPELIAEIVADAANQPGALPLVQFAMTELFDGRTADGMTRAQYLGLGGIVGSVATRADETFERADSEEQRAIKQVLLRLVALGEGRPDTRVRVARSAFDVYDLGPEVVDRVITRMGRLRLLTFDRDPTTREPTVEIAHEALLDAWPRLRGWIDEAHEDLRSERKIEQAAWDWTANNQDPSFLLHGARLEQAASWLARTDLLAARNVRRYVTVSVTQRDREAEAVARQRDHDAAVERRSARRLRALVAVFAAAALVAGSLTLVATSQRHRASDASELAATRELTAASLAKLETDPELAVLLGIEAVERSVASGDGTLPQAEEALHRAIAASRIERVIPGLGGRVVVDGNRIAAARADQTGMISIVDASGDLLQTIDPHDGPVRDLAFGVRGTLLLTFGADGWLRAWDINKGKQLWRVHRTAQEMGEVPFRVSVDRRGTIAAAAWPKAGRILVIDARTGRVRRTLRCDPEWCQAALSSDGREIAVVDGLGKGGIEQGWIGPIVDDGTRTPFDAPAYVGINGRLSWSADGRFLSGSTYVWDAQTGELLHAARHGFLVSTSAWAPDGQLVTGAGGTARLWEVTSTQLDLLETVSPLGGADAITDVAFTRDGERLITASGDALRIWDVRPLGNAEGGGLKLPAEYWSGIEGSPDGGFVIQADQKGQNVNVFRWVSGTHKRKEVVSPVPEWATVDVNPKDGSLLTVDNGHLLTVDGRTVRRLPITAEDAAWMPDGTHVVMTSPNGSVALHAVDGSVVWHVDPGLEPSKLVVGDDGRVALAGIDSATDGYRAVVLDGTSGDALTTVHLRSEVDGLVLDPKGRWLVTSGIDHAPLQLWSLPTGELLGSFPGERAEYRSFSLDPDGTTLAVMGDDQAVRLYDVASRHLRMTLPAPSDPYGDLPPRDDSDLRCYTRGLAFSPDGSLLAAQGCAGVRIFALDVGDLLGVARQRVHRSLTSEECQLYLHVATCPE